MKTFVLSCKAGRVEYLLFSCNLPNFGVKDLDVRLLVPSRKNSIGANPFWSEKRSWKIENSSHPIQKGCHYCSTLGQWEAHSQRDLGGNSILTLSMVLTYSEKTDQYSLSPPNDLRMKKAPDIRSISPTSFIPMKSAGKHKFWVQIITALYYNDTTVLGSNYLDATVLLYSTMK